jgi:thiamine kinase-like enzyme
LVAEWEIAWLLDRCQAAARVAASLPPTVIHGEFYASNVLVEEQACVVRICPLDWETAGLGPALIDVAALISGSWPEENKEQLAAAYFTAVASDGAPTDVASQAVALCCCRLLLAIKWVGWSPGWQPPPEHRYDWLAEALDLARRLNSELRHIE